MGEVCYSEGGLGHGALPPVLQRRREQVVQACERCRRSRLKCDSVRPCSRCVRSLHMCVDWRVKRRRSGKEDEGRQEGIEDEDKNTNGYSWEDLLVNPEVGKLQPWTGLADEAASEESIEGGWWEELALEEVAEGSGAKREEGSATYSFQQPSMESMDFFITSQLQQGV
ncbi:hypothetical protein GUITHDRAFT_106548 [Guillardia theta CCMP2712]|uniref:Zn(2)-C6 fungal-type domain-containing protein n=1 Tax=Guillardia theta (strain CCMP2712) TaxID=905079 RepID=L1JGD8_GUITC|nr:hypothetical protein GUITHDRAFT_106548 [Guillardia theta CCMP2712]EKX47561.1 hypothetical protein GUITHDRAFT_106548 [Guillardia theta CCMP2712]|eukprot:XP_005834541.1 hypothetical protein GUITHDRAFT_106548 [Guillardia theta CCMP2712]